MISKMLQGYVEHLAKKNKISVENFRKQLLNGESNDDGKRSKKN